MQTLESISRRQGERYYTLDLVHLTTGAAATYAVFGNLDSIVSTMDATIGDDRDPAEYRATISDGSTALVVMPTCAGPDSAVIVAPAPATEAYEIRQIDALAYDDGWTYNTTYRLGTFTTTGDVRRAFRRALARLGITFYRGRTATEYDGSVYEIIDRATGEPLFAAIPTEEAATCCY